MLSDRAVMGTKHSGGSSLHYAPRSDIGEIPHGHAPQGLQASFLLFSRAMSSLKPLSIFAARKGLDVRKQVYELTLHDLATFPVWEFGLDEEGEESQDESTVRPYPASGPLNSADRMFVIRAIFTLADGSRMQGYFTPPRGDDASIGTLQPIIVTDRGQVRFWCGTAVPDAKRLARSYAFLGKNAKQVFPARFESDVKLVGGAVRNSLPGFLVLEDFQTRRTRIVK